jgi:DNA-binding NarL/FixJ family response regulator
VTDDRIQMPLMDGIGATRQIVADARLGDVRVVILTNYGIDEYVFRAPRAGASGFLLKDMEKLTRLPQESTGPSRRRASIEGTK